MSLNLNSNFLLETQLPPFTTKDHLGLLGQTGPKISYRSVPEKLNQDIFWETLYNHYYGSSMSDFSFEWVLFLCILKADLVLEQESCFMVPKHVFPQAVFGPGNLGCWLFL